jgi:hypothetical protein
VRARIDVSISLGFMAGAVLSGLTISHSRIWPRIPPCVVMVALALLSPADEATPSREKTPKSTISAATLLGSCRN